MAKIVFISFYRNRIFLQNQYALIDNLKFKKINGEKGINLFP
jgi:hypothetical protein